tara:strand:+ start:369 stop:620 length:252 start_codon:yes stop_codon:yes gene_type:complete
MSKKIKLIWDFKGPEAAKIAEHHSKHLLDYALSEKNFNTDLIGVENINDMQSLAYIVVDEPQMRVVRDKLRPHRGVYYDQPAD